MSVRRVLLIALLSATAARGAELRNLKGETIAGDIVSITEKEVVVSQGGKNVTTPLAQILQIDLNPAGKPSTDPFIDVELTDGSLLHCEKYTITGKEIALRLLTGQEIKLPLAAVSSLLTEAQVEKDRQEWSERLKDRKAKMKRRDVLAIRKEGVLNALEGTIGDGDTTGTSIEFTSASGKKRTVAQTFIAGLIFEREVDANAAPVICKVTDSARDLIQASAVVSSKTGLTVTTPCGAKFELTMPLVVRLDYSGGKLTWLSDLEPTQVVETFVDNHPYHYRRDHNLEDGPIRLDNVIYPRGLSLHATTELEYDLNGDYREFKAVVGIDDLIGGLAGPTVLRIEGDGKLLKELTFDRRNKVRHQEVGLNIKDVRRLRLRVAPGSEGSKLDFGLHLDLGNAKVSK
jgi:NPCBM/NEW2 domain-containing protein